MQAITVFAFTYLESEILLSTAVVGLRSVSVEKDRVRASSHVAEEGVLLHHPRAQLVQIGTLLVGLVVQLGLEVGDGGLPVSDLLVDALVEGFVLRIPLFVLFGHPRVDVLDFGFARRVLALGEVLQGLHYLMDRTLCIP